MSAEIQDLEKKFTKYEIARILGARALQIAMDAPLLIKIEKDELERIKYDPIKIAEIELRNDVLPITIRRPLPRRAERELTVEADEAPDDSKIDKIEEKEEEEIKEGAEIMELASPEDEASEEGNADEEDSEGGFE